MLLDLQYEAAFVPGDFQGVADRWQLGFGEVDVDDDADDFGYRSSIHRLSLCGILVLSLCDTSCFLYISLKGSFTEALIY